MLQKVVTYAYSAGQIMNRGTLCTYFLAAVKNTAKYPRTYEDWIVRRDSLRTLAHLQYVWRLEHLKSQRFNSAVFQFQYDGNAKEIADEMTSGMAEILKKTAQINS